MPGRVYPHWSRIQWLRPKDRSDIVEPTPKRQYPSYRDCGKLQGLVRQLELPYECMATGLHVQATGQEGP
jgi:hypothetical protein